MASGHISAKMVLPTNIKLIRCSFTPIELRRCPVLSVWVGQFIQELNRGLKCERVSFGLGDRDDVCNTCVGLRCVQHSSVNMSQPRVLILPVSGTDGSTGWEKEDCLRGHKHSSTTHAAPDEVPVEKIMSQFSHLPILLRIKEYSFEIS